VYEINSKIFLLADVLLLWGRLRFGKLHFPLAGLFYLRGCLRLQSSFIQVNIVKSKLTTYHYKICVTNTMYENTSTILGM